MDHLVCGGCGDAFGLRNFPEFIQHKHFTCPGDDGKRLMCQSCQEKFSTPWGLLQHAQSAHLLKIFLDLKQSSPSETSALKEKGSNFSDKNLRSTETRLSDSTSITRKSLSNLMNSNVDLQNIVPPPPLTNEKASSIVKIQALQSSSPDSLFKASTLDLTSQSSAAIFTALPHIPVLEPIKIPQGAVIGATLAPGTLRPRIITYNAPPKSYVVSSTQNTTISSRVDKLGLGNSTINPPKQGFKVTVSIPELLQNTMKRDSALKGQLLFADDIAAPISSANPSINMEPNDITLETDSLKDTATISKPENVPLPSEPKLPQAIVAAQPRPQESNHRKNTPKSKSKSCPCCERGTGCDKTPGSHADEQSPTKSNMSVSSAIEESASEKISEFSNSNAEIDTEESPTKNEEDLVDNEEEEEGARCCNNQDCGITIMPGTHESLKKCCNAVVPKKRKRHMETKHRIKKRANESGYSAEENTIYIDFQANSDLPCVSASNPGVTVSTDDQGGSISVNTSTALLDQSPGVGTQSPRSLTLSIPVSYTRKAACSLLACKRPVKLPPEQAQDHMRGCRCDCCPLALQLLNSVRDIKARRRSGSTDGKQDSVDSTNDTEELREIIVKTEDIFGEAAGSSPANSGGTSKVGLRKMKGFRKSSLMKSQGGMGKKRQYPTSRPFKCDQCDHAFNQRIHLKKHQSKHTGIKPFKCEQCDYSTVERSHLKVHIRVHTGEKPFKCSFCDYATAQNSTLKLHLKRHHGQNDDQDDTASDSPLYCLTCRCMFDSMDELSMHSLIGECSKVGSGGSICIPIAPQIEKEDDVQEEDDTDAK